MHLILTFFFSFYTWTSAQEDPLLKPVRDLFTGMEMGDSTMVRNAFMPEAQMRSIVNAEGGATVRSGNLNGFVTSIGTAEYKLAEPIWNIKVEKDGNFAQVWADYALYIDGKFNHCGVDAFHLVNTDNGWKILLVTDTRRNTNCTIPEDISSKYEY